MRRLYRETYQPALVITTTASTPVGLTIDLQPYTQPVWIDWGDGVQEIVTGGLLSHTYATQAARVLRLVPLTSRPLGDTLIVSAGSSPNGIGLPVATIPRSITRILNLYQCSGVTGNVADLPRVTYYLSLSGCSGIGYAANYFSQYGGTYRPSTLTLSSMGWNQASVDATLADLVAATSADPGWTTCTLNLSGNAAPSAQGLADRDILVSRGWTVTVAA